MMVRVVMLVCGLIAAMAFVLWRGVANPPHEGSIFWQSDDLTSLPDIPSNGNFTLEVTAILPDEQLAEWGIWLDNGNGTWAIVAINGGQYVTARTCPAGYSGELVECMPFTESDQGILTYWKSFHHIQPGGKANTIRLHYTEVLLELRLNNEWMWDIPFEALSEHLQWGLWAGSSPPQWEQGIIWN